MSIGQGRVVTDPPSILNRHLGELSLVFPGSSSFSCWRLMLVFIAIIQGEHWGCSWLCLALEQGRPTVVLKSHNPALFSSFPWIAWYFQPKSCMLNQSGNRITWAGKLAQASQDKLDNRQSCGLWGSGLASPVLDFPQVTCLKFHIGYIWLAIVSLGFWGVEGSA